MNSQDLARCLERLREINPLTLCITNQVTINDCANGLLAVGASPVMSDDPADAKTLGAMAASVVINIGTINDHKLRVSLAAAGVAKKAGRPVVLDPVGAGASATRLAAAARLIEEAAPEIIRGNLSEIKALAGLSAVQKGVDSAEEGDVAATAEICLSLARRLGAVVAVTGPTDVAADKTGAVYAVTGGSPLLTRITGAGCMLSAICGGYAATTENPLAATVAALSHMALAGAGAAAGVAPHELGTFRVKLFDRLAALRGRDLVDFEGAVKL